MRPFPDSRIGDCVGFVSFAHAEKTQ
jgi:hypothetical protein